MRNSLRQEHQDVRKLMEKALNRKVVAVVTMVPVNQSPQRRGFQLLSLKVLVLGTTHADAI